MTVPFWCLLVAIVIPYVLAGVTGYLQTQSFGSLDSRHPRMQRDRFEEGPGSRAVAAQANAWEALPAFGAAVFVNHLAGGDPGTAATLALVWVVLRILAAIFYVADVPLARSGSFLGALICVIGLFVSAA